MADLTHDDLCYVQYTILIVVNYGCHHIGPDIWVCWQIYVTNICRWLSIKDAPSGNIMCPTFLYEVIHKNFYNGNNYTGVDNYFAHICLSMAS